MKTIFLRYIPRARVCPSSCGWGCAGLRVDLQTIPLENDGFIHAGEERLILALSLSRRIRRIFFSIHHTSGDALLHFCGFSSARPRQAAWPIKERIESGIKRRIAIIKRERKGEKKEKDPAGASASTLRLLAKDCRQSRSRTN